MTNQHPITLSPELVLKWQREANHNEPMFPQVAAMAAQWGADRELEECCLWLNGGSKIDYDTASLLRAARRPKPPSLKERALKALDDISIASYEQNAANTIRQALEALND